MGVLKVNVGDAVTPDWRKVGCGSPGTGRLKLWTGTEWVVEKCGSASVGANLLTANQNGLETGSTTGWAAEVDPSYGATYTVLTADTAHAYAGTYSLKAGVSAATGRYFSTPGGTSGFPVTAGVRYRVSSQIWRTDSSGASRIQFDFRWYDSSGTLLSTTTGQDRAPTVGSWQATTFSDTSAADYLAPAGAAYGAIYCQCTSANNLGILFWFDDVRVEPVVAAHPLKMWDGTSWVTVACMVSA